MARSGGQAWWRAEEGSTTQLLQLCGCYFGAYVVTGVTVKVFTPLVGGIEYLLFSTIGGTLICLTVVMVRGWYRLVSSQFLRLGPWRVPRELLYVIPSGVCTAVVIPTTTLMYTLPISVMVAMVIMRGSIIVISRLVDAVQIAQGILKRRVYWEEEVSVVLAIAAVGSQLVFKKAGFDFVHNRAAVAILTSYLVAYLLRIYIMNYYKNTRPKGAVHDAKGFFGVEQMAASSVMLVCGLALAVAPSRGVAQIELYQAAILAPHDNWPWQILAGVAYGLVAFFSVFLFMFKGRTATFAGLVNRLTSLIAGTAATIVYALLSDGRYPEMADWVGLGIIFVAVGFMTRAERKRAAELRAEARAA